MPFDPMMSSTAKAVWLGEVFRGVDWLIPAFLSMGFVETLGRAIEISGEDERLALLRDTMIGVYNPEYIATMFTERYSKVFPIQDFAKQIDECFRAFFSGYKIVAVTSMIPVLEGVIRKIAGAAGRDVGSGTAGLLREFEALVAEEKTAAHRYEERLIMFELLLEFLRERFLKNTSRYAGLQNFNRHGILHGVFDDFGEELNFLRIVMILDLLLFVILYRGIARFSVFSPEPTAASRVLATEYRGLHPDWANKTLSQQAAADTAAKWAVRSVQCYTGVRFAPEQLIFGLGHRSPRRQQLDAGTIHSVDDAGARCNHANDQEAEAYQNEALDLLYRAIRMCGRCDATGSHKKGGDTDNGEQRDHWRPSSSRTVSNLNRQLLNRNDILRVAPFAA
jgi:hypothetical protein